ncbi:MAG TPA: hypothetical protein VLQ92_12560, partial [Candidatus Limnocylindrales bacterium]|nr:hypothetical protein [Candidatus Limnocylindrales bacterium]
MPVSGRFALCAAVGMVTALMAGCTTSSSTPADPTSAVDATSAAPIPSGDPVARELFGTHVG